MYRAQFFSATTLVRALLCHPQRKVSSEPTSSYSVHEIVSGPSPSFVSVSGPSPSIQRSHRTRAPHFVPGTRPSPVWYLWLEPLLLPWLSSLPHMNTCPSPSLITGVNFWVCVGCFVCLFCWLVVFVVGGECDIIPQRPSPLSCW